MKPDWVQRAKKNAPKIGTFSWATPEASNGWDISISFADIAYHATNFYKGQSHGIEVIEF